MNYSKQRELIINILRGSCRHPTAEEILSEVRAQMPDVARGTVYRNLNRLVEAGEVIKICIDGEACRYDYIAVPHSHAVCSKCGRVVDLPYIGKGALSRAAKNYDFSVTGVVALGVCSQCKSGSPQV